MINKCFIFLLAACIGTNASAQIFGGNPSKIKWYQINTDTARIIFTAANGGQAQRIANTIHLIDNTSNITIGGQTKKINMVLQPQTTIPNAYVRMAPFRSELNMTPGSDNFSDGSIRWDDNLSSHEYRHVQQFMNFNNGLTKAFSFFLGEEGQLLANGMTIPDYFFEGDAVFQETLVSEQGRGRISSFFDDHKAIWQANKNYSWMRWRNGSLRSLSPNHYPTGYILLAYGYEKYGADFWKKVTQDATRFKGLFYPFNNAVKRYSGVSYRRFCNDAFAYFKSRSFSGSNFYSGLNYLTKTEKNNVVDYLTPQFISNDEIVALRRSYKKVPAFIRVKNGNVQKIRVKDIGIDDHFSYRNGKIVYSAYNTNARWGWAEYSDIRLLDINTGVQKKLTAKGKYFSPDINETGNQVVAVHVKDDASSELHIINSATGAVEQVVPNPGHYFFIQPKFINSTDVVAIVRDADGKMAPARIRLADGNTEILAAFSYKVVGDPFVKGNLVYFGMMQDNSVKIFALDLDTQKMVQLTDNDNGVYGPTVNDRSELVFSTATADGRRLAKLSLINLEGRKAVVSAREPDAYAPNSLVQQQGAGLLSRVPNRQYAVSLYRKASHLFNFHSRRPVFDPPEYGYSFSSDNMLNTFSNTISYSYNENEKSHKAEWITSYGGWLPVIFAGASATFNREFRFSPTNVVNFNSATARVGAYIPLTFVSGRTSQGISFGGSFNAEQLYYTGIGKDILDNRSFNYGDYFMNFSSSAQKAQQHIFPHWAQNFSLRYRDALTLTESHKFTATGNLYFPGLLPNHSIVVNLAFQKRDTMPDIFSNNFPFSRGYQGLTTRRMYKLGANYHFPVLYPDAGFANVVYIQRIRANAFFDYSNAKARLSGVLQEIEARTIGGELNFDGKIWNALPVSIGVRYNHLLDRDLLSPGTKNVWEIIIPIGLIPD